MTRTFHLSCPFSGELTISADNLSHSVSKISQPILSPEMSASQGVCAEMELEASARGSGLGAAAAAGQFPLGSVVWAKIRGCPWWPGIVVDSTQIGMMPCEIHECWIFWLGDHTLSKVPRNTLLEFSENCNKIFKKQNSLNYETAVAEACKEYARQNHYQVDNWNDEKLISWGIQHFPGINITGKSKSLTFSPYVSNKLNEIALKNVNKNRKGFKIGTHKIQQALTKTYNKKQSYRSKTITENVRKVKGKQINIGDMCLACTASKNQKCNILEHPVFEGGLCTICLERFKMTFFALEDDSYVYCCICGHASEEKIVCADVTCKRTYCSVCMKIYSLSALKIKMKMCFLCTDPDVNRYLIKRRGAWKMNIFCLFLRSEEMIPDLPPNFYPQDNICVLSLFDNAGTGSAILQKFGIKIKKYYSTTLNGDETVSISPREESIINLGNIKNSVKQKLVEIEKINLLMEYIPSLSPYGKDVNKDYKETATLEEMFFDFYLVKRTLQKINKKQSHHMFWLYATEISVSDHFIDVVNRFLECSPISSNSTSTNNGFYWTNIPVCKSEPSLVSIMKPLCTFFK